MPVCAAGPILIICHDVQFAEIHFAATEAESEAMIRSQFEELNLDCSGYMKILYHGSSSSSQQQQRRRRRNDINLNEEEEEEEEERNELREVIQREAIGDGTPFQRNLKFFFSALEVS